jgi:CCR4-NOT transcription complex subunit 3
MFVTQSSFRRLDTESLFFAFYFQQRKLQQYLAAFELKRRGWEFNYRFMTWIKRELIKETATNGRSVEKMRTYYFDFENEWRIKTSSTMDL